MLTKNEIIEKAYELGFGDVGFTGAEPFESQKEILQPASARIRLGIQDRAGSHGRHGPQKHPARGQDDHRPDGGLFSKRPTLLPWSATSDAAIWMTTASGKTGWPPGSRPFGLFSEIRASKTRCLSICPTGWPRPGPAWAPSAKTAFFIPTRWLPKDPGSCRLRSWWIRNLPRTNPPWKSAVRTGAATPVWWPVPPGL